MRMLSCAAMGDPTCPFVAKAETDQEVVDIMTEHVKTHHVDKMGGDMEAMKFMMMSKMQDA